MGEHRAELETFGQEEGSLTMEQACARIQKLLHPDWPAELCNTVGRIGAEVVSLYASGDELPRDDDPTVIEARARIGQAVRDAGL